MYAHQVIEDFTKYSYRESYFKRKNLDHIIDDIKNSICFNFGNPGELLKVFNKFNGERLFSEKFSEFKNLPFKINWFDYDAVSEKVGILIHCIDNTDIIAANFFLKAYSDLKWEINPRTLFINIGSSFEDCYKSAEFIKNIAGIGFEVKEYGNYVPFRNGTFELEGILSKDEIKNIHAFENQSMTLLQASIMLLMCKNINYEKNYPPEALNKKRIKQGKQPLFTYHTLVVNPMSEKKRNDGPHEATGIKQRLHFCRGHFKEYTEQNKLFGKHTGLYWWQPMVRGNKELGLVHKDYQVKIA